MEEAEGCTGREPRDSDGSCVGDAVELRSDRRRLPDDPLRRTTRFVGSNVLKCGAASPGPESVETEKGHELSLTAEAFGSEICSTRSGNPLWKTFSCTDGTQVLGMRTKTNALFRDEADPSIQTRKRDKEDGRGVGG
jgi:hypothetical protein